AEAADVAGQELRAVSEDAPTVRHRQGLGRDRRVGVARAGAAEGRAAEAFEVGDADAGGHRGLPHVPTPLTTFWGGSPRIARAIAPAADSRRVRTALALAEAMCDVTRTSSSVRRGLSAGRGSVSATSSPAAAIRPSRIASTRAAVSA